MMFHSTRIAGLALLAFVLCAAAMGMGNEPPPAPAPPSEEPAVKPAVPAGESAAAPAGEDAGKPQSDVEQLAQIARAMRISESLIRNQKTAEETQRVQADIVGGLSKLIDKYQGQGGDEQRKQPSGTAPSNTSGNATAAGETGNASPRGTQKDGTGKVEPPATAKDLVSEVWGRLPEVLQRQIQSPLREQFLPGYEKLISDYYKRLAEDQQR
jgi:hypothetical protein